MVVTFCVDLDTLVPKKRLNEPSLDRFNIKKALEHCAHVN